MALSRTAIVSNLGQGNPVVNQALQELATVFASRGIARSRLRQPLLRHWIVWCTHPTSAVLPDAGYFANCVTLSLALRSSGDAGRGVGRFGAAAALVAG